MSDGDSFIFLKMTNTRARLADNLQSTYNDTTHYTKTFTIDYLERRKVDEEVEEKILKNILIHYLRIYGTKTSQ